MIGPPYRGDMSWSCTRMSSMASARASSLWGTCRFISSPSKSALYGGHTDGCRRNVLPGSTRTWWAIMDIWWSDGCLLNITMSPSIRCLSIRYPISSVSAIVWRFST